MSTFQRENAELGSGGYGKVVKATNKETGEMVAAKIISTGRMKMAAIQKEVSLMKRLDHKHIIGFRGVEEEGKLYIIYMELATGGELFSKVISSGTLPEPKACEYFLQLMSAVQYMHAEGVVHRDLKLENVLLDANDQCKVCDFGLAHVYEDNKSRPKLREVCGSKSYCAPEVLQGHGYDGPPTDVWSCGICLFAMLAGFFPLDEASGSDWRFERVKLAISSRQSTCHTIYNFYERSCTLSRACTDLIDGMLQIDVSKRLTVEQALSAPWGAGAAAAATLPMPGEEELVYRCGNAATNYRGAANDMMSFEEMTKLLATESESLQTPIYRGATPGGDERRPPMLMKQNCKMCPEFHIE